MLRVIIVLAYLVSVQGLSAGSAYGQTQDLSNCKVSRAESLRSERAEDVSRLYGSPEFAVQIDCDDMQFFADYIELEPAKDRIGARGHVVFVSGGNRVSADRMEFNTKTKTGTFYNAFGTADLGDQVDRSLFGAQEPDAFFWGEELHKLGPKKYRIERGGFTTCVQPTPRWEISSGSVTLNLDDYALLTNSVFKVKGVPLLYLPVFYYPIQEDDRATGFLLPTYGASTVGGQSISNAFFWAIGRSHDATLYHTWLSKTGQSYGSEYRYVLGPGAQGNGRFNLIDEHEATYTDSDGSQSTQPAQRSYNVGGDFTQPLPGRLRARANADYFSSVTTQQKYQQNIYQATNRRRRFGTNVNGAWGAYVLNVTADRNDVFYDDKDVFTTNGSLPRVTITRGERPLAGTPFYFGVGGEYVTLVRSTTRNDVKTSDQGLTRFDVSPILRLPFRRWPFLTVNSSVGWRATYWTESLDEKRVQVPEGLMRRYFDFQSRITGPVFNRVWNTPGSGYAEKLKHVIEPTVVIQRVTAIDEYNRIVRLESADYQKGQLTRVVYGVTNRLYAKKETSREIASLTLSQSYYTDAEAALYDRQYQSSFHGVARSKYTPLALQARASPTDRFQAEFRTEWDPTVHELRTLAASGTFSRGEWLTTSAGWSQRRLIEDLPGFNDPENADHYLNAVVDMRGFRNRVGGMYSFNYDLRRDRFLQQRYTAYYNAQCCGIGVEYQTYNLSGTFSSFGVPKDRRFNVSFTLAGIGTFSNLFGAFGGQQER